MGRESHRTGTGEQTSSREGGEGAKGTHKHITGHGVAWMSCMAELCRSACRCRCGCCVMMFLFYSFVVRLLVMSPMVLPSFCSSMVVIVIVSTTSHGTRMKTGCWRAWQMTTCYIYGNAQRTSERRRQQRRREWSSKGATQQHQQQFPPRPPKRRSR